MHSVALCGYADRRYRSPLAPGQTAHMNIVIDVIFFSESSEDAHDLMAMRELDLAVVPRVGDEVELWGTDLPDWPNYKIPKVVAVRWASDFSAAHVVVDAILNEEITKRDWPAHLRDLGWYI